MKRDLREGHVFWRRMRFVLLLGLLATLILHAYVDWDAISEGWGRCWNLRCPLASARHFDEAIREADRLVIRDGGFDEWGLRPWPVLAVVTDPAELREVRAHIRFEPFTNELTGQCMCTGYPGLDWYKGTRALARVSVQHGMAIRWKRFGTAYSGFYRYPGDVPLTLDSSI